jgi:hypothetical protein
VLSCLAVWGATTLLWPFGSDQGYWAWIGDAILHGAQPYRDAWDTKGPVAYYLGAIPQLLFGRNQWGVRVVELGWMAVGGVLISRTGPLRQWRDAGFAAGVLFVVLYGSTGYWHTAQPDGWGTVLIIAAVSLVARDGTRAVAFAASGAFVALAMLIKPTFGVFLLLPALASVLRPDVPLDRRILHALWATVSCGAVIMCVLGLMSMAGSLDAYLESQRWAQVVYAGLGESWLVRLRRGLTVVFESRIALLLPLIAIGGWWAWQSSHRRDLVLAVTWLAVAFAAVLVQGKFFVYHWVPVLAPLAWLAGLGVGHALSIARDAKQRPNDRSIAAIAGFTAIVPALALAFPLLLASYHAALAATGLRPRQVYLTTLPGIVSPRPPNASAALGSYLREHSAPDDYVYVFGGEPGAYFLSDRRSPTRFATSRPVMQGGDGSLMRERFRRELLADLDAHPPLYVVAFSPATCARLTRNDYQCVRNWPDLADRFDRNYHVEATIGPYEIMRRGTLAASR